MYLFVQVCDTRFKSANNVTLTCKAQTVSCWQVFAFYLSNLVASLVGSERKQDATSLVSGNTTQPNMVLAACYLFVASFVLPLCQNRLSHLVSPEGQTIFYLPVFSPQLPDVLFFFLPNSSSSPGRVGSESSFRTLVSPDQLHWLHKWLAIFMCLLWFLPSALRDGCHWLASAGWCLCTVCSQYSLCPSCHLVDLAVLFSVVQRLALNCIKLYRLWKWKKINEYIHKSWMLHSRREKLYRTDDSDLKCKK